jgi:hypothetical protein
MHAFKDKLLHTGPGNVGCKHIFLQDVVPECINIGFPTTVVDLQCQVRVGHKRENFNISYYNAYYNIATVLKWTVF